MKRALELSLAISLALGAGHAWAVGLGQIQVKSRLNQPLVAEIPVTVDRGSDAESLAVSLASAEEFSRIGIDRSQIGVPLEFAISKSASGQTVIRVTSTEPVRAPFLDFLLAANWSNGRVLREYTVLLDPPSTAPAVAAMPEPVAAPMRPAMTAPPPPPPVKEVARAPSPPAAVEPAKPAPKPAVEPSPQPEPAKPLATRSEPAPMPAPAAKPEPRSEPAPVAVTPPSPPAPKPAATVPTQRPAPSSKPLPPSVAASNGTNYGPVAAGETLWEIAQATMPEDGVSANQLMLALLKANPQAFSRNNINRLKRGAILRIPSAEDIRAVGSMREATAQVRSQIADWRQQNAAPTLLAGTAAANVNKPDTSPKASGKAHDDRLALVPPEMGKDGLASTGQSGSSAGAAGGNASAAELARANETLASSKQETGELRSRVKDLEELKTKNDRLISLKDSEIADLQRKLAAAQTSGKPSATGTTAPEKIERTDEATSSSEPAIKSTEPAKDDIWGSKTPTTPATGETPAVAPAVAAKPESTTTPIATEPTTPPPATASTTTATSSSEAQPTPPVSAPAAAIQNPGNSADATSTTPTAVEVNAPADEQPWYLDPRILGGAGIIVLLLGILGLRARRRPVSVANRPSISDRFDDAGPLAGGMTQPAGGIVVLDEEGQLAEQVAQHPDDLGARLELLSIYYADNRVDEFRAAALEMQPYVDDPSEAEWVQVRAMGEDLLPHDPLFSSSAGDADVVHAADVEDDWSAGDDTDIDPDQSTSHGTDPNLRWSGDVDDGVESNPIEREAAVVVAPAFAAVEDVSRYAPAPIIETPVIAAPDDMPELDRFDDLPAAPMAPIAKADDLDRGLDFALDNPREPAVLARHAVAATEDRIESAGPQTSAASAVETTAEDSFEFDLPALDFDSEFSTPRSSEPAVHSREEVGEDLDEEFLIGEDALGTKLDLARAYADMGDPDGARGMLEEVIAEGDAEQQDQARKLLAELR